MRGAPHNANSPHNYHLYSQNTPQCSSSEDGLTDCPTDGLTDCPTDGHTHESYVVQVLHCGVQIQYIMHLWAAG